MPPDASELPENCQWALTIFHMLPDLVSDMGGVWLGKDFAGLEAIMNIYDLDDRKDIFELILICIKEYTKYFEEERKRKTN